MNTRIECNECENDVPASEISRTRGGLELCKKCYAKREGISKRKLRVDIERARSYHDFREPLPKSGVQHAGRAEEYPARCWCGAYGRHKVLGIDGGQDLVLCTKHFTTWFKLPKRQQKPKTPEQRKADRLKRTIAMAEELGVPYTPKPPFDGWAEREIVLKTQLDPCIHFTGKKIAQQALRPQYGRGCMYFTVYQQTVDPKSYFVSVTAVVEPTKKTNKERRVSYWVMEVEYKKNVPDAIKAYLKTLTRPRSDYGKTAYDYMLNEVGDTVRVLYRDLKLRNVKDALQITTGKK